MQRLEVSGAVRFIYRSLGVKGLKRPDCESQHLPPSYSDPQNSWNYTSIFPYSFLGFTGIALLFVVAACAVAVILTLALSWRIYWDGRQHEGRWVILCRSMCTSVRELFWKIHREELRNYFLHVRMRQNKRMKWAGYIACVSKYNVHYFNRKSVEGITWISEAYLVGQY